MCLFLSRGTIKRITYQLQNYYKYKTWTLRRRKRSLLLCERALRVAVVVVFGRELSNLFSIFFHLFLHLITALNGATTKLSIQSLSFGISHDVNPGETLPLERLGVLLDELFTVFEMVHAFVSVALSQTFSDQFRFFDVDHALSRVVFALLHERDWVGVRV